MSKKKTQKKAPKKPTVMPDPGRCNGEPVEGPLSAPGDVWKGDGAYPGFPAENPEDLEVITSDKADVSIPAEASGTIVVPAPTTPDQKPENDPCKRFTDQVGRLYIRQPCGKLRRETDGMMVEDTFAEFVKA